MRKYSLITIVFMAAGFLVLNRCNKEIQLKDLVPQLPSTPYKYEDFRVSDDFGWSGGVNNAPSDNVMTDEGAALGRVLFYDPRLSINNTISCASCHKQQFAFADNAAFSAGFEGNSTSRNTPALINESIKSVFFWDGRVSSLEEQTLMPVRNHVEMGLEKADILEKKIRSISYYPDLFKKAFGTSEITSKKISKALSQFVRSIVSSKTSLDNNLLSSDALAGRQLFFSSKFGCGNCHTGFNLGGATMVSPYMGNPSVAADASNIGLDEQYSDAGIGQLTGKEKDNGFFIIPSLRNIELTAPYMHDGRFKTLDEVIEHYSSGIKSHPNLDANLVDSLSISQQTVTVKPVRMNMSIEEKEQLKAFLKSLTDYSVISDKRFSNPFK